jgi:hypothetical protein
MTQDISDWWRIGLCHPPRATVVAGADGYRTASVEWFMTVSCLEDCCGLLANNTQERVKRDYVQEYFKLVDPLLTRPREFKVFNRLEGFYRVKE